MKRTRTTPPLPTRFQGPKESLGFLLWKLSNAWQRRQRAALKPFGLTHSQFVLLASATWFGSAGPLTQARLAEVSGVDPMTTSQIVRALETARLLERRSHPQDPRANLIVVTAAGRQAAGRAVVAVEGVDEAFFAPVAKESRRLLRAFRTLADAAPP